MHFLYGKTEINENDADDGSFKKTKASLTETRQIRFWIDFLSWNHLITAISAITLSKICWRQW